jgi:hypothetical protein
MVFHIKMDGSQKICDINKNVSKIDVIIKGINCMFVNSSDKEEIKHWCIQF